jgi:hypothetical protein
MPVAAERVDFVIYDGTNSADILVLFESVGSKQWRVAFESGGVLNVEPVEAEPDTLVFHVGDYAVVRGPGSNGLRFSPTEFVARYAELP